MNISHGIKTFASFITILVPGVLPDEVDAIPLWVAIIMCVLLLALGLLLVVVLSAYLF
jgi:hypothetical protein